MKHSKIRNKAARTVTRTTVAANGKTFEISGDATASECTDQSAEAAYFMQAIRGIANFYRNTEEYKSMPEAEGGYE